MNEQTPLDEQTVSPRPNMSPQNRLRLGLMILIALLLAIVAGGYAYLYTQKNKELQKLQAADAPTGVTEPAPSAEKPSAPAASKVDYPSTVQTITIKEWGVEMNLINGGTDFTYIDASNAQTEKFTSVAIVKSGDRDTDCAYGFISRVPETEYKTPVNVPDAPRPVATINGFVYTYSYPSSACPSSARAEARGEGGIGLVRGAIANLRPSR